MSKLTVRTTGMSTGMKTELQTGAHSFIIDEPENFGGKDQGPDPLSVLLGALVSCENVVANMVAKEINFDLQGIEYEVTGELDLRGLMGDSSVRTYFSTVTIEAKIKTSETEERVAELQKLADSRCPIFQTLKAANVAITSIWTKA